jgi:hypothetical protein
MATLTIGEGRPPDSKSDEPGRRFAGEVQELIGDGFTISYQWFHRWPGDEGDLIVPRGDLGLCAERKSDGKQAALILKGFNAESDARAITNFLIGYFHGAER